MWRFKKKFKVLKEWLWIDYYSLDNALFEQNLLMTRLREENKTLEEENRLLKNEITWLKDHTKYNGINEEEYIDWTMTATEAKLRLQQAEDNQNYVSKLEKENRKLKEELEWYKEQYEHSMWEDIDTEIVELVANW